MGPYRPMIDSARRMQIARWHDQVHKEDRRFTAQTVSCLSRTFVVPPSVFLPGDSGLWQSVEDEIAHADRVLDMGTGSGINAVFAAAKAKHVDATDINPDAITAARENARLNHVASRITVRESNLFDRVTGLYDVIMFDPPFWWFKPVDMWDRSSTDENYRSLIKFFASVHKHLAPSGRILLYFSDAGDVAFVEQLIARSGYDQSLVRVTSESGGGLELHKLTYRLTRQKAHIV